MADPATDRHFRLLTMGQWFWPVPSFIADPHFVPHVVSWESTKGNKFKGLSIMQQKKGGSGKVLLCKLHRLLDACQFQHCSAAFPTSYVYQGGRNLKAKAEVCRLSKLFSLSLSYNRCPQSIYRFKRNGGKGKCRAGSL